MNIQREVAEYSYALVGYETAHGLPVDLFSRPDHVAIKAEDIKQFEELVHNFDEVAAEVYCYEDQNRFIVAAKLSGRIALGLYGPIKWVEIKEPRRHINGHGLVGVEHAEFYYPDFGKALDALRKKDLGPIVNTDGEHKRIKVVFSTGGHEVRVTDTPLEAIITEKVANEEAYILKMAA